MAEEGNVNAMLRLARIYRDGDVTEMDQANASKWFRRAIERGSERAKIEYFTALWDACTPESLREMIDLAERESKNGNPEFDARLARAYRYGKGVDKDLRHAADLMKKAQAGGPQWSNWEYFDILWEMGSPEADAEMFGFALSSAESGQKDIQVRLARCYRHGRGTLKDLDSAAEWMRRAISNGSAIANNELFDILWNIGTPESYKEAFEIASARAEQGDVHSMSRLARCYREGRGVNLDMEKANEWNRKASSRRA